MARLKGGRTGRLIPLTSRLGGTGLNRETDYDPERVRTFWFTGCPGGRGAQSLGSQAAARLLRVGEGPRQSGSLATPSGLGGANTTGPSQIRLTHRRTKETG